MPEWVGISLPLETWTYGPLSVAALIVVGLRLLGWLPDQLQHIAEKWRPLLSPLRAWLRRRYLKGRARHVRRRRRPRKP